ncbi:LPXTG cell wall anchor domain-containing protein [Enterococcus hirae]
MKKILLSTIVLVSFCYGSQVTFGDSTDSTEISSTIGSTDISSTMSSTSDTNDSSTSSTTPSNIEDSTSSSSTPSAKQNSTITVDSSITESQSSNSIDSSNTINSTEPNIIPNPIPETTEPSAAPKPSLTAKTGQYDVKNGAKITKNDLLKLVNYKNGDKNNLDITITSIYAYVSKNGQQNSKVYHTDLDALLGTANLNNIQLMTISQAQKLGLTLAQGNANKNIEVINCSLPGQYNVSFTDRNNLTIATHTIVTVGNPASEITTENNQNSGSVNQTTNNVQNQHATPKVIAKTPINPSTVAQENTKTTSNSTSKATLPKTNEKSNHFLSIMGIITTLVSSAFILIKKIG